MTTARSVTPTPGDAVTCAGCGGPAVSRALVAHGAAAASAGVEDGEVLMNWAACDRCMNESQRELDQLRAEFRRLRARLRTRPYASAMMCRRVDRYFLNGTLRPLPGRAK